MGKVIEKDKPLPEHTKLDYYECYAKTVLEQMFPERFSELRISDKPDLQNELLDIGFEVTSSRDNRQMKAESLYVKWNNQSDEKKVKTEKQIKKCSAKINGGILQGVPGRDDFDRVIETLKIKIKKEKDYASFGKQYLFIFSDIFATRSMRENALEEMCHICSSVSQRFDGIYVLVPGAIYVFDITDNVTFERKINSNTQCFQAESAREMVTQAEKGT